MDVDVLPLDDIHDQSGNNILDENFFDEDNHLEEVRTGMRAGSKSQPRETERLQIRHEKRVSSSRTGISTRDTCIQKILRRYK